MSEELIPGQVSARAGASPEAGQAATGPAPPLTSRRNTALVAVGIFLSRLAGFARERAMAYFLGVGPVLDAFRAALRIPNLMQNLLGEGVLSASFIPVYSRLLAEGRDEEAGRVAGAVLGLLTVVAGTLVVVGVVFAGPLTDALTPGFSGRTRQLTVTLMRILTPGVGFLVLSAWCLGVLNSHRRFFLSYVAPVLWNVAQIAALTAFGLAGLADAPLAEALAWGALAGGVLQFGVQLPSVLRLTRGIRPSLDAGLPGVRETVRAFAPIVAGRGVVQLLIYVDIVLASLLVEGAVAALGYAQTLFVLPISLFGMSAAAAELPELSRAGVQDRALVASRLEAGLARIAFYVGPSALAFFLLGDLLVGALYQTGEFGPLATRLVWLILAGFSLGLLANTSSRLLQSALYGAGNATTPAKVAALRVVVAGVLGAVLMLQLDRIAILPRGFQVVGDLPAWRPLPPATRTGAGTLRLGAVGLAVAAGASSWLEYALLRRRLQRQLRRPLRTGGGQLPRILVAVGVAGVVAAVTRLLLGGLHPLLAAPLALGLTGAGYLAAALRLGVSEAVGLVADLKRRSGR